MSGCKRCDRLIRENSDLRGHMIELYEEIKQNEKKEPPADDNENETGPVTYAVAAAGALAILVMAERLQ